MRVSEAGGRLPPASWRNSAAPSQSGPIVQGTPKADRAQTIAHLTATVQNALGHVRTHMQSAMETSNADSRKFNLDHAFNHLGEAIEHHLKMIHQFQQYWPQIASQYDALEKATDEPLDWHDGG